MAKSFEKTLSRNLRNAIEFLGSRRSIPMFKGTLAYMLVYIFIFLRGFDDLSAAPQTYFSIMIVIIAIQPGTSVGACIQSTSLAVLGISLGCVWFVVLAKLSPWPVAQAFVFAFIVYTMALVRGQGLRWFNFSLFCVLNAFNGIFTSYSLGSTFSPKLLIAFYISYLWAAAIAMGVNLLVFPYSAETELRRMLVTSLEHVGAFVHLLAKEYTLDITEEERAVRNRLNDTIRADFGILSEKFQDIILEVNYTRYSMKSYETFIAKTRSMQQALITAHSNLASVEKQDHTLFREHFLPSTALAFADLRRAVDLTLRSISNELESTRLPSVPAAQMQRRTYRDYVSQMEAQAPGEPGALAEELTLVAERLAAEVARPASGSGSSTPPRKDGRADVLRLRREFDTYADAQHRLLLDTLVRGHQVYAMDGVLRVQQPRASLQDTYPWVPSHAEGDALAAPSEKGSAGADEEETFRNGHGLIRVWGFVFALEQFVTQLEALSHSVLPDGIPPPRRIRAHFVEALQRVYQKMKPKGDDEGLALPAALALLEKRPYMPTRLNIWQHLERVVKLAQCPTSIFAAKNAAATSIYAILIYANSSRPWFINYVMSPGIMTIVVALEPTLGQSMVSFVLQIVGSGVGYLWGFAVLEMFRDVGGYTFNPFGITCMVLPFALIMQYVLYSKPKYFVLALLAMNALGVIIATEWVGVEYLHVPHFDSPALLTAKGFTALGVSVAIAAIFQLVILRNPAHRTLRKRVADVTFEILSYTVLLQALGRSLVSLEPNERPAKSVVLRIERELRHRELRIQCDIINLMPLLSFSTAEPQFAKPFRKDIFLTFIQSNQIILDRLRESRAALGTRHFEDFILRDFAGVLAPYRTRHRRGIKTQLYMTASALRSKAPLPHDTPMRMLTDLDRANFMHDVLVLSSRFAKMDYGEGDDSMRAREFVRYVAYLLPWTVLWWPLRAMEEASKELWGELESKLL